jgi:Ca-activated chloride channel family protein
MGNGGKIEASRRALGALVERARPGDELALASFAGGRLAVEVPFTTNRGAVHEAMAAWDPYGTTALHDAVAWIPDISAEGRHPKRAVLLVTDGVDNASTIDPEIARRVVERAHLPVYVVGLGGGDPAEAARNGDASDTYARLLQRLARASGGRYFAVESPGEVAAAVRETLGLLRREYVLGFPTGGGESEFRRIRVEVEGGRRTATHRLGYTGGPPLPEPPETAAAAAAAARIPAR